MTDPIIPTPPVTPTEEELKGKEGGDPKVTPEEPKTFTQEQLDKVVSDRLSREKEAMQRTIAEEVKKATDEAARLAKMNADEREKELLKKQADEQTAREESITIRENKADAITKFAELGLPLDLVGFVVSTDKTAMASNIDSLKKSWDAALQKEVQNQLKGTSPKDPASNSNLDTGKLPGDITPGNFI